MKKTIISLSLLISILSANEFSNKKGNMVFKENNAKFISKKSISLGGKINKEKSKQEVLDQTASFSKYVDKQKEKYSSSFSAIKDCERNAFTKIDKEKCWDINKEQAEKRKSKKIKTYVSSKDGKRKEYKQADYSKVNFESEINKAKRNMNLNKMNANEINKLKGNQLSNKQFNSIKTFKLK